MKPCRFPICLVVLLGTGAGPASTPAFAAPDEIQVMTDDLTDAGDLALAVHAASVRARASAGTRHVGQGLAELSYGLSDTVEVSLQLPASSTPGWRADGLNAELQYVAPHGRQGWYWGTRVELGGARGPLEPRMGSSFEVRPIVGYRLAGWHGVFNGAVRVPLSGPDRAAAWEPSGKLSRDVGAATQVGLEYYVQAAQRPDGDDGGLARRKLALLVLDTRARGVDLSVGVGRGMGAAADGPVVKFIAGFELPTK